MHSRRTHPREGNSYQLSLSVCLGRSRWLRAIRVCSKYTATRRYAALEDGASAALAQASLAAPAGTPRGDALQVVGSVGAGVAALPRPGAAGVLPSHISIFGDGSKFGGGFGGGGGGEGGQAAASGGEAGGGGGTGGGAVGGAGAGTDGGGVRLPSHISVFGEGSGGMEGGGAADGLGLGSHALQGVEASPRLGTPPGARPALVAVHAVREAVACGYSSGWIELISSHVLAGVWASRWPSAPSAPVESFLWCCCLLHACMLVGRLWLTGRSERQPAKRSWAFVTSGLRACPCCESCMERVG